MTDDTTTNTDTTTLTLVARGPAVRVTDHGGDDVVAADVTSVRERHDVELEAKINIDADTLSDLGSVYKQGALLQRSDVAEHVVDSLSTDSADYRAGHERHDGWELTLHGRVDDWLTVAVGAARAKRSAAASDERVATTACCVLDDLAELAETDRPRLAQLDLLDGYDVAGISRDDVLAALQDDDQTDHEVEVAADA